MLTENSMRIIVESSTTGAIEVSDNARLALEGGINAGSLSTVNVNLKLEMVFEETFQAR